MRPTNLPAGELSVTGAPARLVIHGLGSCVAVFLYDPKVRVGGLAHILLPEVPNDAAETSGRYAPTAVKTMIDESIRLGARHEALYAKVAGGSRMFSVDTDPSRRAIGEKNVDAVLQALRRERIEVVAHDLGGDRGRTVTADLEDGSLTITTVRGTPKVL